MIRVAMIVRGFPIRQGDYVGIFNYRLARVLNKKVHLTVLKISPWKPGEPLFLKKNIDGIPVILVNLPFLPPFGPVASTRFGFLLSDVSVWIAAKILSLVMRREPFDVIHSVGIGFPTIFGAGLANASGAIHIAQMIGSDVNVELKKRPLVLWFMSAINGVAQFIANSRALRDEFLGLTQCDVGVQVIYRGTDLSVFKPRESSEGGRFIRFLFLGGAQGANREARNKKGALTLIDAWRIVERRVHDISHRAELVVAGSGTEDIVDDIKDLSAVRALGRVAPDDVPGLISASDMVVIPSRNEGFPNVGMEAFASAKPVVASTAGGLKELVDHKVNGLSVDPLTAETLADALAECLNGHYDLPRMGSEARNKAERLFDGSKYCHAVLGIYAQTLRRAG